MLTNVQFGEVLFLDIETVPAVQDYAVLEEDWKQLWLDKSRFIRERDQLSPEESYYSAGIHAEFGRIICIGVGYFGERMGDRVLRVGSFSGHDELKLLRDFANLLETHDQKPFRLLCAHNGKEFDFPYLCRRMLIQGIALPRLLDLAGKKPWEVPHLDTMELWKFGDYKHYTSLRLLAHVFGIPTPKDDIDGSQVREVYYRENNLERIDTYCRKDVITTARLFQRYKGEEIISDDMIVHR